MSVHYKFKSALDFDTITFDGLHITVSELKKAIIFQKRLGKTTDFDLKITNAQTKEDYDDDSYLIPKNTSLIIARIPLATLPKRIWEQQFKQEHQTKGFPKVDKVVLDLSKMIGSEEEKIQAMMQQSAADYDPKGYQKVKGQPQIGEVPPNYRCNKCKKVGHWIKNCPYTGKDHIEMKRTTGIPKSFREKDERSCEPNKTETTTSRHNGKIPDNLICSICKDIFTDAVMIPCCGSSFCDDCVRTSLLESDDNECPDCREKGSSPGSLIPNRFLRNSVNAFKNETGYKRPVKQKVAPPSEDSLLSQQILINDQNPSITAVQDEIENKPADHENNNEANSATQSNESTSADESDYEDNITVTVPSATAPENNTAVLQIKTTSEGNSCTIKKTENTPRFLTQVSTATFEDNQAKFPRYLNSNWDGYSKKEENEETQIKKRKLIKPLDQSSPTPVQNTLTKETQYQLARQEHYQQIPLHTFTSHQTLAHAHPIGYSQISTPHCNRYPHYAQPPYTSRIGCMPMGRSETPQLPLSVNLASVYEGVAAKVGSGIIDDPLEAFNRIMREKEKNKEHQRSPIRRISRSKEKTFRKYSPQQQRSRAPVSPYDTKTMQKVHQRQSREREKIFYRNQGQELSRNYQKRSSSLSDRSSRTLQHGNTSVNYLKRDRHENEDLYKNNLSDICPPGTSERPPPGFENSSYKREYRRNQKPKHHDDYIKNRNYERHFITEYDVNKTAIHSNGKESFQKEISKKELEGSRQYSPYKSTLKERSQEFDLNPKNYTIFDERETSQKDIKYFKDMGRKQSQKDINMIADECPIQKVNIFDAKTDNSNKHYKQQTPEFSKIKPELEAVTRSDKTNSDHEKKVKERKKKKKSKDEKERKRQKKDGKGERHIGRRYQSEKDSCGKPIVSENSELNITKNKTKYRDHTPELHRNIVIPESSSLKNSISVNVMEENIKHSEENSQDGVHRPLTGISKWEREDENMFLLNYKESSELESLDDSRGKVNTEVLRRAENALFSRNIGNKNSSTHQKCHIKDKSSPHPRIMKRSHSRDSNTSKDLLSVKLHQSKKIEKRKEENIGSLTKSVKSRLGIKVTKNVAKLDSRNINKYRSRSRSIGRNYYCGKEDSFEPDQSKKGSYIYKNKAKYHELQDYKDDLQQMRYSVSKNLGPQRSKRTSEVSKERKEVDSNKRNEHSKTIQYDKKKEETASKITENKELKTIENKTKAKESKVNKIEKESISSLKHCSSIDDKSNSSVGSDNGLESDSAKRKKKRKSKKEKRRRKRLSSTESVQCSKKKHSKNKKKNKKKKKEL